MGNVTSLPSQLDIAKTQYLLLEKYFDNVLDYIWEEAAPYIEPAIEKIGSLTGNPVKVDIGDLVSGVVEAKRKLWQSAGMTWFAEVVSDGDE